MALAGRSSGWGAIMVDHGVRAVQRHQPASKAYCGGGIGNDRV
jgi:hypothetical protein